MSPAIRQRTRAFSKQLSPINTAIPGLFSFGKHLLLDNFLFSGRLLSGRLLPALLSFSKRPFDRARSVHCLYQASDKDTAKRGRLPKADWLA